MSRNLLILIALLLSGCGPSEREIDDIASVTCNIISESNAFQSSYRIKELNAARQAIGAVPFLGSDDDIRVALSYGLCKELVKNEKHYSEKLDAILREESENKARELAKLREAEREQREWQRKVDKKNASIRAATEQMLRAAEDRQVREMIASRNKFASVDDRNSIPPYEQDSFGPDTLSFRIFFCL